jgi:hypothetical protein
MDHLKEIVNIVTRRKIQQIDVLDKSLIASKDSVMLKLHDCIRDEDILTDEQAIKYMYGELNEQTIKNYRQLKAKFKRRLLNTLFFLDINNKEFGTEIEKQYYECTRSLQLINIIQKYGENHFLIKDIIKDYYKTAEEYKFYAILTEYNLRLIDYYSIHGNFKKIATCKESYYKYRQLQDEINEVHIIYREIDSVILIPNEKTNIALELCNKNVDKCKINDKNYLAYSYKLLCKIMYYDYYFNREELSLYIDKYFKHLNTEDNLYRAYLIGAAYVFKLHIFLQDRAYDKGLQYLQENINQIQGLCWFEAMEIKFRFAINMNNLELCKEIYGTVCNHTRFKQIPIYIQEKWLILDGYYTFYERYLNNKGYTFNINKLVNQLHFLYHDKRGYYFSVLILQLLSYLSRNDKNLAYELINNLKIYKSRYLNDEKTKRNNEFVKVLLRIIKVNNNKINIIEQEVTNNLYNNYYNNNEIIEYEKLIYIVNKLK